MKVYTVKTFQAINTTRYVEGDVFTTDKQIGVLQNGKIEPLVKQSELKGYVKKSEVSKLIEAALKKVNTDG